MDRRRRDTKIAFRGGSLLREPENEYGQKRRSTGGFLENGKTVRWFFFSMQGLSCDESHYMDCHVTCRGLESVLAGLALRGVFIWRL